VLYNVILLYGKKRECEYNRYECPFGTDLETKQREQKEKAEGRLR